MTTNLKDRMTEITTIVKNFEDFKTKKTDIKAELDVVISYDGEAYARIFETEDGLELDVL